MLHQPAIEEQTFSLLRHLQSLPFLSDFSLAGGTALALKHQHSISEDLDLFGDTLDKELILKELIKEFGTRIEYEILPSEWALFCYIDKIKVDIVKYDHPLVKPIKLLNSIRLFSDEDIAAMKVNAILGIGTKKDFWDMFELLNHFSLSDVISFHRIKFPQQMLLISIPQALSYFEDAENNRDPISLKNQNWENIKRQFEST
ncbi:MAG: nucleotidyl transferase AbiEii/AbiGii toxin family protein [Bacteroidota bacterium]